jgi:branched-subunit amino acid ABC-type transport system permease component
MLLQIEQCLNGLQFGLLLFLLAAGLTLVFGIMDFVRSDVSTGATISTMCSARSD